MTKSCIFAKTIVTITYFYIIINQKQKLMKKLLTLFAMTLFAVTMSAQQWVSIVQNSDMEGTENANFVGKENNGDTGPMEIIDGIGVDGSRGIKVVSAAGAGQDWDTQFWIVFDEPLYEGDKINVSFDYKASQAVSVGPQAHGLPGDYHDWTVFGWGKNADFDTEWKTFEGTCTVGANMANGGNGGGFLSIAFNLSTVRDAEVIYYFDNIYVTKQIPEPPKEIVWTSNMILNGDCEADADYGFIQTGYWRDGHEGNVFSFAGREVGKEDNPCIENGAGVDGTRGVAVHSVADAVNGWDTQFFITTTHRFTEGEHAIIKFDYRSDDAANVTTQWHELAGDYNFYIGVGDIAFTPEWQHFEQEVTFSADQVKDQGGQYPNSTQTLTLNLNENLGLATTFYFDNIEFYIDRDFATDADWDLIEKVAAGPQTVNPEPAIWTVAGNFVGSSWNPEDAANDMTSTDNVTYTLTKEEVTLEKGVTYEFKVAKDHAWTEAYPESNYTFTVEETAIYTVTVTFNAETKEVAVTTVKTGDAQAVEHAYSVMGTLGGDSWTIDNDMTKGEDGLYTVTFEDVAAGNYEFKVRVDHDWSVSYPESNYQLTVEQDGSTVTITFNEETKEITATATSSQAPPVIEVWTVAGNFVGSSWNPEDAANDLTSTDGVTYTLTKEEVTLEKGVTYEFKVAKDHAWTEAYPENNYTFTVEETAIYTVTVTFNAETKEIAVTTVKTGDAQAVEHTYSVIGTLKGDSWSVDNDMTKGEDGIYTLTLEDVAAGNYEFKVRVDHDWSVSYPGSNYQLTVEKDGSKVVISFNEETKEVTATVTAPSSEDPAIIWEGDGSAGAVSWNGIYRFALEGHDGANECIAEIPQAIWDKMMTETFYADIQAEDPQVRITTGWWDTNLTSADIQPGNELLTDNGDGTWTVKVNLADNPDLVALLVDHHLLFTGDRYTLLKLYFKDATGIKAPVANEKAVNGAIYNLSGQKVGASYKGIVIVNGKKVLQK